MGFVEVAGGLREHAILRHGITYAWAREDEAVNAAKGRNHDGESHDSGAKAGEDELQHGSGDAVGRGVLYGTEREDAEISDVRQEEEAGDADSPESQRTRHGDFGIFDLASSKRDVMPGVRREE